MIHDQSSSGSTLFIEPMAVVTLNNQLKELEGQEQTEIERILALLSEQASYDMDSLAQNKSFWYSWILFLRRQNMQKTITAANRFLEKTV